MDKNLTHTAEEYREAVKLFKRMAAAPTEHGRGDPAHGGEARLMEVVLEALRYAALRVENPPLTRAHLKGMHGQVIYLEQPFGVAGVVCGVVDCNDETIVVPDHGGVYRAAWFHGLPGRYYRFPLDREGTQRAY